MKYGNLNFLEHSGTHQACNGTDLPVLVVVVVVVVVLVVVGDHGGTVVKVLCYKSEGRWFDSRWCHWNFSVT